MKLISFVLLISIFLISSCSSQSSEPRKKRGTPRQTPVAANANVNTGNSNSEAGEPEVLSLTGTAQRETMDCKGRNVEIDESTTANTFTLTGECKKVVVDGVSNKVFLDKVGEIVVKGTSNKVYYDEDLNETKPKISKEGASLVVKPKNKIDEAK